VTDSVPAHRLRLTCVPAGYRRSMAGISLGGLLVIIGIVVAIFWSVLWGVILALIGLVAFGGFARGRWY
jgi:hypothetical protein